MLKVISNHFYLEFSFSPNLLLFSFFQDVNDEIPTFRRNSYFGEIRENAQKGTPITFLGTDVEAEVFDYDSGSNGTFNLYVDGDQGIFEVGIACQSILENLDFLSNTWWDKHKRC